MSCLCPADKSKWILIGVQQQFSAGCSDQVASGEHEEASAGAHEGAADGSCPGRWCDASRGPSDHGTSGRTKVCLFL